MNLDLFQSEFDRNFSERGDLGASVSVWRQGREVLTLEGGYQDRERTIPWQTQTPVLFWSATKGLAAATYLHVCQEHAVSLDCRVIDFWPEFGAEGKGDVTLSQVLSHQAGLSALDNPPPVTNYEAVIAALAAQAPKWPLGSGHGYHPRTFGFLLDELLRRITGGTTLGAYFRDTFAKPLDLQLWIGLPETLVDTVAPVFASSSAPPKDDPFYKKMLTSGTLTARTFMSPKGMHSTSAMNAPEARMGSFPAFGGIGTAQSLARFYALLANGGELEGRRYFTPETLVQMSTPLVNGPDLVLQTETAFSAGFMQDPVGADGRKVRLAFGPSRKAFGHPGAGGGHAFADPELGYAFAYVMNQMEPGVLPGQRSLRLVEAMYAE